MGEIPVSTDDDEDEFDYWFNASDEEVRREDARINAELAELDRRLSRMTVAEQVAHHRHFLLMDILKNRERLRDPKLNTIDCITRMWRDGIKRGQLRLIKLRVWRTTGVYPGAA
jgi:hypothetical protein